MDLIVKRMLEERDVPTDVHYARQRWRNFYRIYRKCGNLTIVGCGRILEDFLEKYSESVVISAFCDTSIQKQGRSIFEGLARFSGEIKCKDERVHSLDDMDMEAAVFLICSTRYYEEIYAELKRRGAKHIFCYYLMERKKLQYVLQGEKAYIKGKYDAWLEKQFGWNDYQRMMRKCFREMRTLEIVPDKLVFLSYSGKGYLDHGKYITEEILRQRLTWEIVWLVNDPGTVVPEGVRLVDYKDRQSAIYELSTAKVWISNTDLPLYVSKKRGQVYIQTKHWTGVTLKKFYLDSKYIRRNKIQKFSWKHNGRMTDFIITGSRFDSKACRRGFRPKGKCIELGSARCDALFYPKRDKEDILKELGLESGAHILIYAPTYRFKWQDKNYDYVKPQYDLDYQMLTASLERKFGGRWYILLRLHPGIREEAESAFDVKNVFDISLYEDIQTLLGMCDILISDYSSIMFEPAYVRKPVFLFATDIDEYLCQDYDMLIDIHGLPFPLAESNAELSKRIEEFDYEQYKSRLEKFLSGFKIREDGHACERIVDFLKNRIISG